MKQPLIRLAQDVVSSVAGLTLSLLTPRLGTVFPIGTITIVHEFSLAFADAGQFFLLDGALRLDAFFTDSTGAAIDGFTIETQPTIAIATATKPLIDAHAIRLSHPIELRKLQSMPQGTAGFGIGGVLYARNTNAGAQNLIQQLRATVEYGPDDTAGAVA